MIYDKGLIISGFAGVGKSHLASKGKVVDLESTPFNKKWKLYANVAIHMANNGYIVAVSAHKELREELLKREAYYLFVKPHVKLKEEYLQRYKDRGNTQEFIDLMDMNWDGFVEQLPNENTRVMCANEYLEDIFFVD